MDFNSRQFSFSDITVYLLGKKLTGLRGIKYKKKQDKERVTGSGHNPVGIQRGEKSYEGTLTILQGEFEELEDAAIAAGFEDLVDVTSDKIQITVVHSLGDTSLIRTDTLIDVEFTEFEKGMKTGDKFKEIELPFIFLRRKRS